VLAFTATVRLDDGLDDTSFPRELLVGERFVRDLEQGTAYAPLAGAAFVLSRPTLDRASRAQRSPGVFVERHGNALKTTSLWSWRKSSARKLDSARVASLLRAKASPGELQLHDDFAPLEVGERLQLLARLHRQSWVEAVEGQLALPAGAPGSHAVWGPYLLLPAGEYQFDIQANAGWSARLGGLFEVEAVVARDTIAKRHVGRRDLALGRVSLAFVVPTNRIGQAFELRLRSLSGARVEFRSIELVRTG
jgi:hypothetical protein